MSPENADAPAGVAAPDAAETHAKRKVTLKAGAACIGGTLVDSTDDAGHPTLILAWRALTREFPADDAGLAELERVLRGLGGPL